MVVSTKKEFKIKNKHGINVAIIKKAGEKIKTLFSYLKGVSVAIIGIFLKSSEPNDEKVRNAYLSNQSKVHQVNRIRFN